jgi:hypothetical protein
MTYSATRLFCLALSSFVALSAWPAPRSAADAAGKMLSDDWCGFSLVVAESWQRAPLKEYTVPGEARCAWSHAKDASIVIFLQEPGTAVSPRAMLDDSAKGLKEKLGVTVVSNEVRSIAGMQGMWLVVRGKGSGGRIDGEGSGQTTQHWVAVPRQRDVVVLLLTCPTTDYARLHKSFAAMVGSLKLSGEQTAEQKAAK